MDVFGKIGSRKLGGSLQIELEMAPINLSVFEMYAEGIFCASLTGALRPPGASTRLLGQCSAAERRFNHAHTQEPTSKNYSQHAQRVKNAARYICWQSGKCVWTNGQVKRFEDKADYFQLPG